MRLSELAAERVTADTLGEAFEERKLKRSTICDFLRIGASTLSDWMKEGKVPRAAALSIFLYEVVRHLNVELTRSSAEPIVIPEPKELGYIVIAPGPGGYRIKARVEELSTALALQTALSTETSVRLAAIEDRLQALADGFGNDGGDEDRLEDLKKVRDGLFGSKEKALSGEGRS